MSLLKRIMLTSLALLFAATLIPAAVAAHEGESEETNETTSTEDKKRGADDTKTEDSRKDAVRENVSKRLSTAKLEVCKERADGIAGIMKRGVNRAEKQLEVFSTITSRVKAFYENKDLTVTNYDELVAATDVAKGAVETALAAVKSHTFSCDSEDPKGDIAAYKQDLATLQHTLKDYRTSIKNLIVAVKSAQSEGDDS